MKKCPFCDAELSDTVIKCKYCGEWVETAPTKINNNPQAISRNPADYSMPQPSIQYPNIQNVLPQPQTITVTIPKQEPVNQESSTFAIITLVMYLFFFIPGLTLNCIGLITGPRRSCFLSMFLLFVVMPAVIILGASAMGYDLVNQLLDMLPDFSELIPGL